MFVRAYAKHKTNKCTSGSSKRIRQISTRFGFVTPPSSQLRESLAAPNRLRGVVSQSIERESLVYSVLHDSGR